MSHPRMIALAFASVLSLAIGCTKSGSVRATAPTEIGVWFYETFPPTGPTEPARFRLNADELRRLEVPVPDLARVTEHACKCGVPRFGLRFYRGPSEHPYAEGHFFHGPDELVVTFDDGGGRLLGQAPLHDAIVKIIEDRGHSD